MKVSRLLIVPIIVGILLLMPLIGMQFSDEIVWTTSDFLVMGILLLVTGLAIDLVLRKFPSTKSRVIFCGIILLFFFLIWAELAVGIFGTPFAGS